MTKWLDPITAARADLEMEVSRLREENATLREVDEFRAKRINALTRLLAEADAGNEHLREQLRKAQERIRAAEHRDMQARSGE